MILSLFEYFAKFPAKEGVQELFTNGISDYPQYSVLLASIEALPATSLCPNIKHFIFGESIEKVKASIDKVTGIFMFIDYGSINSTENTPGSVNDRLQMAVTVASKVSNSADLVEEAIASNESLLLLNIIRAHMLTDSSGWLQYMHGSHTMDPFVSAPLCSIGWTLTFDIQATDLLNVRSLVNLYRNE